MTKDVGVGILGFGTVGAGVADLLLRANGLLAERTGVRPVLRAIADTDLERDRGVPVDRALLSRDAAAVVDDPRVNIVVELIGGTGIARDLTLRALALGKPVITANKALLAQHGPEIFAAARARGAGVYFEAAVAGGVPVIRAIRQGLAANRIDRIYGILNGTCNYILTRMEEEDAPFETVLREAQAAGYAEADPSLDVDGHDTAHKAAILATLACGRPVPLDSVRVEGIRRVSNLDLEYAHELGYRIKLLAVVHAGDGTADVAVGPCLVPAAHLIGQVRGVFNAVLVKGDAVGDTLYHGRGAGRYPTASAIVGDVADAARRLASGSPHDDAYAGEPALPRAASSDPERYYLRLTLPERPGMLGRAADILGSHGISIASVVQREGTSGPHVPVLFLTHRTGAEAMRAALRDLAAVDGSGAAPVCLRIEDLDGMD